MSEAKGEEEEEHAPKYLFTVTTPEQEAELARLRLEIDRLGDKFVGCGLEHPKTLQCVLDCAELCYTTRKFEEAAKWFRHAWQGVGRAMNRPFELPHIIVYRTQSRLAKTLCDLRRFKESEPLFREALAGLETHLGLEAAELIPTVDGLAIVLHELLKLQEAEDTFLRLRRLHELNTGPMHPDTLSILNRLAMVLRDSNKLAEADRICVESLENCTIVLGRDHPTTQTSVEIAAYVRHAMGLSEEAEDMFRLALGTNERQLGYDHPNTVTIVSKIGMLLSDQEDYEQSEEFHRRALKACIDNYGRDHERTLDEVHFVGVLVLRREEVVEGEHLLRWALTGRQALYPGIPHPSILASAHYLAVLMQRKTLWRYDPRAVDWLRETEELYRVALQGRQEMPSMGPSHKDTLETAKCLAVFLDDEGRFGEAENLWRMIFKARKATKGLLDVETADAAYALGTILQHQHRYVESAAVFMEAVEGYRHVYAPPAKETKAAWEVEEKGAEEELMHPVLEDAIRVQESVEKLAVFGGSDSK